MCVIGRESGGKDHDTLCPAHPKYVLDPLAAAFRSFNESPKLATSFATMDIALSLRRLADLADTIKETMNKLNPASLVQAGMADILKGFGLGASDPPELTPIEDADAPCTCLHRRVFHIEGDGPCNQEMCPCEKFTWMTPKITPERLVELAKEGDFLFGRGKK
jgi:hypothetical protein